MSSFTAARCRHIKVNGTQCGSPALRNKIFCFYHHKDRPLPVPCFSDIEYRPAKSTCRFLKTRTPFRPSFARWCRWCCKRESSGKPPVSCSTRSRSPLPTSSAWNSKSRNQSRLSPISNRCWILTTPGKLPSPAPARPRANLQPARPQQIAIKKLARSTSRPAKTFRPEQSRPVIAPDHKPRIALAIVPRDGSNM
jgi:hypothetical protein